MTEAEGDAARAHDEGLREPASDDADWQESVYLAWRDPATGLGGNHRIGNELNRATANLWCGVYRDDGTRFRHNDEDLPLTRLDVPGLQAGPQRLFHDGSCVRFVLDGEGCSIDFVIDDGPRAVSDARAFAGSNGPAAAILQGSFHSFGRARGTVTLDGRTTAVDARAWRDHSWGVRRWESFLVSRTCCGAAGDVQFRYGSMVGTNGSFLRHGSLARRGNALAVASSSMLATFDDDSLRCPQAELRYVMDDGSAVSVRIDTIGGMLAMTRERCGWEAVGDVCVDGEPGGWGFLEVNNNPRNGSQRPAFVLGDAATNGITRP